MEAVGLFLKRLHKLTSTSLDTLKSATKFFILHHMNSYLRVHSYIDEVLHRGDATPANFHRLGQREDLTDCHYVRRIL